MVLLVNGGDPVALTFTDADLEAAAGLNVDANTTDSINGKIGTDTEMADHSLFDMIAGAAGIATFPASAVPADNVSLAEVLRDIWDANRNGTGGSEPGANKSIIDALGFNGLAALTSSAGMLRTMAGTLFVVKKTLTSSAILQAGVDVTLASTVGDIMLEAVMLKTDGTGLAAGTNLQLVNNNAKGAVLMVAETVANLGASKSVNGAAASVTTFKPDILETGKKVTAKATVADCTGAGTIDVYLICRRLADGASLVAA